MPTKIFIDTNVLVYAMDEDEPRKRDHSRDILASLNTSSFSHQGVISTQILQETYVTSTRKLGVSARDARIALFSLQAFEIVTITPSMVFAAMECCQSDQLSFWDALVITSAAQAGCNTIWTEDLNAGQIIRGVHIVNPFD